MKKVRSLLTALAAGTLLAFGSAAQAGFFASTITNGPNTYEDQSREAYVDANRDGLFSAGDVLVGFVRLDQKTTPTNVPLLNRVYGIFTQEVASISATTVFWKPTTVAGLTLDALLGFAPGTYPAGMVGLYSLNAGFDLIGNSPGDVTGNGTVTLKDYLQYIKLNGTLELIAGMTDGPPFCTGGTSDCFTATSTLAGGPNAAFIGLPDTVTVASFLAGLEVLLDPPGAVINDVSVSGVFPPPATAFSLSELVLSNGAVRGYANAVNNAQWINASELTALPQCTPAGGGTAVPCGFINDVDISFNATRVPEPATLALLGLSLVGMAAVRRRRSA